MSFKNVDSVILCVYRRFVTIGYLYDLKTNDTDAVMTQFCTGVNSRGR